MKAKLANYYLEGTVAADISDLLALKYGDFLQSFGKYYKINETRFKVIGISIWGSNNFGISLLCVDKKKSTDVKEHIVKIFIDDDITGNKELLSDLFKHLHIVLHSRLESDKKYLELDMECAENVNYSDLHKVDNKK